MVIYVSILFKKKQNHNTIVDFFVEIINKNKKKIMRQCVFFIVFFKIFKKYGHETIVNLQHFVLKID